MAYLAGRGEAAILDGDGLSRLLPMSQCNFVPLRRLSPGDLRPFTKDLPGAPLPRVGLLTQLHEPPNREQR